MKNSRWTGVRDAIVPSPTCLQIDFIQQYNISGTEDCLYLNVYTPKVRSTFYALFIEVEIQ